MRIREGACTNLAEECSERDADPVRAARIGMFSNTVSGKRHLEVFVERELNGDVSQPQESRRQAGVE